MEESCVLCGKSGTIPERRRPVLPDERRALLETAAAADRRANDYHRRAQKMAAALSRAMDTGASDRSFGRALANAGHCAQRTLRETAEAELAVLRTLESDIEVHFGVFADYENHPELMPERPSDPTKKRILHIRVMRALSALRAADAELAKYRARYDGDLTREESDAVFSLEEEYGHRLSWAQRDRLIRMIRERRAP
jgi:hypothetical protein